MSTIPDILSGLRLKNDSDASKVDYANLPKQRGAYTPPPQPSGPRGYLLGLPNFQTLKAEAQDPTTGEMNPIYYRETLVDGKKRFFVMFRDAAALLNYGPSDSLSLTPTLLETMINNNERAVGKAKILTSTMANLLVALNSPPEGPGNLAEFSALLLAAYHKTRFIGVTELNARCDEKKDIYAPNDEGKMVPVVGRKGCGLSYGIEGYVNAKTGKTRLVLPEGVKEGPNGPEGTGLFATKFACHCGASLNANVDIVSFRPVEG